MLRLLCGCAGVFLEWQGGVLLGGSSVMIGSCFIDENYDANGESNIWGLGDQTVTPAIPPTNRGCTLTSDLDAIYGTFTCTVAANTVSRP